MNVELEDGTVITDVPEGTTKSMLMSRVNKMRAPAAPQESPTSLKNLAGAAIEPNLALLSGSVAAPIAGLKGLATGAANALGLSDADPAEAVRSTQEALTYAPRTEGGKTAMEAISYPFKKLSEGGEYVGNKLQDLGAPAPVAAAVKTAIEAAPVFAGGMKMTPNVTKAIESGERGVARLKPMVEDLGDIVKGRAENIAIKGIKKAVGQDYIPEVRSKLMTEGELVKGSPPTAAEVLHETPAGSPIQAIQNAVAKSPGGPSAAFGERIAQQELARKEAKAVRDAELIPQLNAIIEKADKAGQVVPKLERVAAAGERAGKVTIPKEVPSDALKSSVELNAPYTPKTIPSQADFAKQVVADAVKTRGQQAKAAMDMLKQEGLQPLRVNTITSHIKKTLSEPEIRVYDTTNKTLDWVKNKLSENADMKGNVSGHDLWAIRKEVGTKIKAFAEEDKNFDKRFTSKLLKGIQGDIDNAIESAGGKGWKDAMKQYAERSKTIESDTLRSESMYKPGQRTSVGNALEASQIVKNMFPSMLSRPIVGTRWLSEHRASQLQPAVEQAIAGYALHPRELGQALHDVPMSARQQMVNELLKRSANYAGKAALVQPAMRYNQ